MRVESIEITLFFLKLPLPTEEGTLGQIGRDSLATTFSSLKIYRGRTCNQKLPHSPL